jgi:hypothetical protein
VRSVGNRLRSDQGTTGKENRIDKPSRIGIHIESYEIIHR